MRASNNNKLRRGALFSLFVTSYTPLFLIVICRQLKEGWEYIHWGGWNKEALNCFFRHFGMSSFLGLVTIIGVIGVLILLYNLEMNLHNGIVAKVVKISNRNSEAIGYIATYIVPFLTSDFSSLFECLMFIAIMVLIYTIYIHSNMILINPLLNLKYSLLEVDYCVVGDPSNEIHDALIITNTKDYKEKVNYNIYQIGFKLYYGKERK